MRIARDLSRQSCVTASQAVLFATAGGAGPGVCRSSLLFIFGGVTNVGGVEGLVVSDHKRTSWQWVTHSVNGATSVKTGPLQMFGIANREVTEQDADTRGAMCHGVVLLESREDILASIQLLSSL